MPRKSPGLDQIIAAEIAERGPVSFARFMELALYHPELGYYTSGRGRVGRAGDFYTNVSVGPVFGRVLAGQFREMWENLGRPGDFVIVEQGANDGQLAADALEALDFPAGYWIVEPSETLRRRQEEKLAGYGGRVRWVEGTEGLPDFTGVHFSNELVDALPFHLARSTGAGWEELFVAEQEGALVFSGGAFSAAIEAEGLSLPEREPGYMAELRPAAGEWLRSVARKLKRGYVLAVDYGFSREQLLAEHRTEGTFSCYHAHRRDARPLENPGEKDITAHVDFTALSEAAKAAGLRRAGWADQHHFMVGAAQDLLHSLETPPGAAAQKTLRALQTLMHPSTMGTQFSYIAFSKGMEETVLSGFRYARAVG